MSGLPDGMANGPSRSEHMGKEAQIWERPWTLEEIRQSSENWSLAADSGLFLFLQDFSQRMLSRTHEIEKQLDSLIRDTKATDSCLHSVFNDFLMLSNTQFIENRVYDEEVEETISKAEALEKAPEQKTREQKEAELIPKMQEAVNYGLRVLESAFEQLDIKAGNSDSEDEEATDRVEAILEPKDLYVDRPLPYLIGSQAFMEQDDVGLGDLSSDEMSVDSDRDSVIESEDGKEADHSDEDFIQEEGHNNIKKKSSMLSYEDDEDDEDEDSDIFGESDKDDEDDTNNTGPSSFADELAARIKGEPTVKPEADRASITSKKKSKSRKAPKSAKPEADDDSDDMFKPPKMDDEEYSPFGGKSGLFSGGRGLFDDDDESDLFSEAPKSPLPKAEKPLNEGAKPTAQTAESSKPGKKIPPGAVSIFPENNLFSSGNESDLVESKENGTSVSQTRPASKQAPPSGGGGGSGGGLFDDEDDDDDFFGGKSSKKSHSAQQEKPKPKKAVDLFDDDDEDGDIFSEKYSAPTPTPSKKVEEEQAKPPEKKMPAGAISMFGPGTKSLLTEGLRKRQPSTSEESEKSEENGFVPDVGKAVKQPQKPQPSNLFSDDEDTQVFPTVTKTQSKPEATSKGKSNKAPVLLFDDEEDEDLFASAAKPKPKPHQEKASTPQPSKAASGSLFSDDDEWLSSKGSAAKQETKSGGMKPSASAPASLPSSLFNDEDDDDLFAPAKETNQKKPQRVALLFEDEDDEGKGSLFGSKPAVSTNTPAPAVKTPAVDSQSRSLCEESDEAAVSKIEKEDKPSEQPKVAAKPPVTPETSESKKKPAGAVSLFGGIDVLASKQTKLDEVDVGNGLLSKEDPPPDVKKEEKAKTNTVSLFDDDEEDESDWNDSIFTPSKPATRNTTKPAEERPQAKSTGVFQDEELLFSQTQQKDNDPDVDLFATSGKTTSSKVSSVKPAAPGLFSDDDEDDLFGSSKPKTPPPKVAEKPSISNSKAPPTSPESETKVQKPAPSPVKPKEPSSRIGKLQANLMINPAMLLPGAAPAMPGAKSVLPGMAPSSSSGVSSSSLTPSPASTPGGALTDSEGGVNFDAPVQVSTLQSANKSRAKGSIHRRPQSRAARQQAAQKSIGDEEESLVRDTSAAAKQGVSGSVLPPPDKPNQTHASPTPTNTTAFAASASSSFTTSLPAEPPLTEVSPRPSALTLPVSINAANKDSSKDSTPPVVPSLEDDLFGSDSLFGDDLATNTPSIQHTTKTAQHSANSTAVTAAKKDTSTLPSIFDDNSDDLFQKVKPKSASKKSKASSFLEEDDDDDDDIFGVSNNVTPTSTSSKDIKNSSSFSKQNIFEDDVATVPKVNKKSKEKPTEASLFDDNIDIFADLTDTFVPKHKSKAKGETKSIFDDDMDDIFSSSTVIKPMTKAPPKTQKQPPSQESSTTADPVDIFDDPLNALGGN